MCLCPLARDVVLLPCKCCTARRNGRRTEDNASWRIEFGRGINDPGDHLLSAENTSRLLATHCAAHIVPGWDLRLRQIQNQSSLSPPWLLRPLWLDAFNEVKNSFNFSAQSMEWFKVITRQDERLWEAMLVWP